MPEKLNVFPSGFANLLKKIKVYILAELDFGARLEASGTCLKMTSLGCGSSRQKGSADDLVTSAP